GGDDGRDARAHVRPAPRTIHAAAPPAASAVTRTRPGGGSARPSWGITPPSSGSRKWGVGPKGRPSAARSAPASSDPPYSPSTALGTSTGGSAGCQACSTRASKASPPRAPEAPDTTTSTPSGSTL